MFSIHPAFPPIVYRKLRLKPREKRKEREQIVGGGCSEGASCDPELADHKDKRKKVARDVTYSGSPLLDGEGDRVQSHVEVYGLRLESSSSPPEFSDEGVPRLLVKTKAVVRVFGHGWTRDTRFVLTGRPGNKGDMCEFPVGDVLKVS